MEDLPESAFIDQLLGKGNSGNPAVVVPNDVWNASLFNSLNHFQAFFTIHCQWLFAKDDFFVGSSIKSDFSMNVVGCANINRIDIFAFDQFTPISFNAFVSPSIGKGPCLFSIACSNSF
jgi:hypothetical protein